MINVTKTFLPPLAEYVRQLERVWASGAVTNHGQCAQELEGALRDYLGVPHCWFLGNGTVALQLAIKALGVGGDVITTPFSYVATTSSIVWEGATPVFADVDADTLTIDPACIDAAVTERTTAILATHVYGYPCDVDAIQRIADRHGLKVIYDAAHCFGGRYQGRSLAAFGDVSTLSFHATKLFHTVEGGAVTTSDADVAHRLAYMRNFGHDGPEAFHGLGINGKNSELHAAMGLCVLPHLPALIERRRAVCEHYDRRFADAGVLRRPTVRPGTEYNYAYYPVIFPSEQAALAVRDRLNARGVFPRRYFYPSLTELPYAAGQRAPVSEDASRRVLCLPLSGELADADVELVVSLVLGE